MSGGPGAPPTRPRILLLGAAGQLGWELRRTLAPLGEVTALGRAEADLADPSALREHVRALRPRLVVNAAAYTAVDRAEAEPELAFAVNASGPRVLAEEAERAGALFVHYSTDYVFPGEGDAPYREDDATGPLNVYGASKLEGERGVVGVGGAHLVLRTSWVYGWRGHNFLRTMLRLAHEREEMRVVDDQHGSPTWSRMVAEATAQLLARCAGEEGFHLPERLWGVYHLAAGGRTTWYEFARAILEGDVRRAEQRCRALRAISTAEYPTPARRPRFSVLDCSRIAGAFRLQLPHWREQLALALAEQPGPRE